MFWLSLFATLALMFWDTPSSTTHPEPGMTPPAPIEQEIENTADCRCEFVPELGYSICNSACTTSKR
jgi:hypothetical protein